MVFASSESFRPDHRADASIDLDAAASAYSGLFQSLGIGPGESLVYATTNYDTVAEHAIRRNGGLPDWGQPPTLEREGGLQLAVPGLLNGLGRYVPVLHLHGRVGWYRRDGQVYATNITKHQQGFGIPIVMLPDPAKVYDQDDIINSLWQQFAEALTRAKRVLVLGHSLNDSFLLRALIQNVEPFDHIAVTVLEDEADQGRPHESVGLVLAKIRENLGNATIIPMRFGSHSDAAISSIRKWQEGLAGEGLLRSRALISRLLGRRKVGNTGTDQQSRGFSLSRRYSRVECALAVGPAGR